MVTNWEHAKKEMNVEIKRVIRIPLKRVMKGCPLREDDIGGDLKSEKGRTTHHSDRKPKAARPACTKAPSQF